MVSSSRCRLRLHSPRLPSHPFRRVARGMMCWAMAFAARRADSSSPSARRPITAPADIGSQLHDYDPSDLLRRQSTKGEQNGCRQRLEGYLSCQQGLALAVA
jgi:hypothetical protein